MNQKPIYLDYNATTPFLKEHFGNPSSSHYFGQKAKEAVEKARSQVANFLNCNIDEIIFTSGPISRKDSSKVANLGVNMFTS